jgi:hypothetical protein
LNTHFKHEVDLPEDVGTVGPVPLPVHEDIQNERA